MSLIKPTPWDSAAFGLPTGELAEYSEAALQAAAARPGHYSIKVDPLADKHLLHRYGFYYCDTLLEPWCNPPSLRLFRHASATLAPVDDWSALLEICHGAFAHGRYHRDFQLPHEFADLRYDNWLKQLYQAGQVTGLYWNGELAGFIAVQNHALLLHALAASQRGQGRAKFWWSTFCQQQFAAGAHEVSSSISASNLAILNLYASLGFRFRNPLDVYHRRVESPAT